MNENEDELNDLCDRIIELNKENAFLKNLLRDVLAEADLIEGTLGAQLTAQIEKAVE